MDVDRVAVYVSRDLYDLVNRMVEWGDGESLRE